MRLYYTSGGRRAIRIEAAADMGMAKISIRFYEELNDLLPSSRRKLSFDVEFREGCTAKAIIEDLGVPHTEVDLILANGESVGFSYRLQDGDRLSVYPAFESWDIAGLTKVRPEPLRHPRFVCDVHLGKLAGMLRLFGFDALYDNGFDDEELEAVSRSDGRIILTRDRGLLKRRYVVHGFLIRTTRPRDQLAEVFRRFDLSRLAKPFSRCIACNEPLVRASKESVLAELPPLVGMLYDEFSRCPACRRVFWRGTHWERLKRLASEVLGRDVV
jgi:uncharacterized protein with PIN domain